MTSTPPVWPLLVLDSGGLTAVAVNEPDAIAAVDYSARHGVPVVVPSVVIAESTRGKPSDARINAVIGKVSVVAAHEAEARIAARLKTAAGMSGVEHTIDALVVATAAVAGGGAVLTSDRQDIQMLAESLPRRVVRAVSV